jgi:hypothetical protein
MFVIALLFYGVVGLFVGAAILHWLGLLPATPKTGQQKANSPFPPQPQPKASPGTTLFVVLCAIGLPLGLAWLGGTFGSGNALFPKGGGSSGYQATPTYQPVGGAVWVDGYYRQGGTYVPGHYRSPPDGDPTNNWSNSPNVNPYTGKPGTHNPKAGR